MLVSPDVADLGHEDRAEVVIRAPSRTGRRQRTIVGEEDHLLLKVQDFGPYIPKITTFHSCLNTDMHSTLAGRPGSSRSPRAGASTTRRAGC